MDHDTTDKYMTRFMSYNTLKTYPHTDYYWYIANHV